MTSLTYYGTKNAATTISTAGQLATSTVGTEGTIAFLISSGQTGWWELGGQSNGSHNTSEPAFGTGNGWVDDANILAGATLNGGTFTVKVTISSTTGITAMQGTIIVRIGKYNTSSNTYTQFGSDFVSTSQTFGSKTTLSTTGSISQTSFGANDVYYREAFLHVTSAGSGNHTFTYYESTTTTGVGGDMEDDTAGYTSLVTNTMSDTASLSVADVGNQTSWLLDALTVSDIGNLDQDAAVDLVSVADIGNLDQSSADGVSVSDLGNSSFWPAEGLSASDVLLDTDVFTEVGTGTLGDVGKSIQWASVESLIVSDTVVWQGQATITESLAAADSLLARDSASFVDGLSVSDVLSDQAGIVTTDGLSASDSLASVDVVSIADGLTVSDQGSTTGSGSIIDGLSTSDVLLDTDVANLTDSMSVADIAASGQSATDSLIVSDSLLAMKIASFVESLTAADALALTDLAAITDILAVLDSELSQDVFNLVEAGSVSDTSNENAWAVESLAVSDSLLDTDVVGIVESVPVADIAALLPGSLLIAVEALVASDSLLITDQTNIQDLLSAGDSLNNVGGSQETSVISLSDALLLTCTPLESANLGAQGSLFSTDTTRMVDGISASDQTSWTDGSIATDGLSALDSALSQDSVNVVEAGSVSDIGGANQWAVENVHLSDVLAATDTWQGVEALSVLDSLLATDTSAWIELLPVSDQAMTILGYVVSESLLSTDHLLCVYQVIWLDGLAVADGEQLLNIPSLKVSTITLYAARGNVSLHANRGTITLQAERGNIVVETTRGYTELEAARGTIELEAP